MIIYIMRRALVAQLDRVTGYEPVGQGFESLPSHQNRHIERCVCFFAYGNECATDIKENHP